MKPSVIFLVGTILIFMSSPPTAQMQSHTLPNNIVFVSREQLSFDEGFPGEFRTSLMRIDAKTLEVEPFFFDGGAYWSETLGWSPNGNLLAVLRYENETGSFDIPPQLCLFTRDGELLSCAADRLPLWVASDGLYTISWSEDSKYVYFLSDNFATPTQGTRRIVEVDVATGETQRVVFEVPFEYGAPIISWNSDLSVVVIGAGLQQLYQEPRRIIILETDTEIDPNILVPENMRLYEICPEFSPSGTYMAILAKPEGTWESGAFEMAMYILDADGNYVFVMDQDSGYGQIEGVACPVWKTDEEAIFFSASTEHAKRLPIGTALSRIFKYDFESKRVGVYFEENLLASGFRSLWPSADGNYLVLSTQYFTLEDTIEHRTWQIIVVFPGGNFLEIKSPEGVGVDWWYPIWVPQASEEPS